MTHRSGNTVWATTESSVLTMKASSLRAGVIRTSFTGQRSEVKEQKSEKIDDREQRIEDSVSVEALNR